LRQLDRLCARMRRTFSSVWLFYHPIPDEARGIGRWLTLRQATNGDRDLIRRFCLKGIRQIFFFHRGEAAMRQLDVVDMHHLKRDLNVDGLVVSDAALPARLSDFYRQSLGMQTFDSASVAARMLYQMHHCAWMPELGIRLLDVVPGETGLFAVVWEFTVEGHGAQARIEHAGKSALLEDWMVANFGAGVNCLAGVDEKGESVLFCDLVRLDGQRQFTDVIAIGSNPSLWPGMLRRPMESMDAEMVSEKYDNPLKAFTWPENWDLSMIFLGWHEGLPAMIEEMALKHHKLNLHVFSTSDTDSLARQLRLLRNVADHADAHHSCDISASVHAWDGMDTDEIESRLRGCKVIMLYPEEQAAGSEDSLLELWYHQVARLLAQRKAKAKWWTPPKLMVLPRSGDCVPSFVQAAGIYPALDTHVGSPDAFHDVFMARQLLNEACRHFDNNSSQDNDKVFRFMDAMLSDEVLVEGVEVNRLLAGAEAEEINQTTGWEVVYRESLRRGWLLMAYLMPSGDSSEWDMFGKLDRLFPLQMKSLTHRLHLLGGALVDEMDAAERCEEWLFCRRGLLNKQTDVNAGVATQPESFEPAAKDEEPEVEPEVEPE
ncbi:MAG: hypothetical protein R8L58_03735, partial [Mariprofundaceae bacterium]